ncbi:hypothetical protein ABTZ59_32395 [Streptomyces sp. NPDC094034]|uniref:hypothetical protein n=1 Tax=Streptomyces sp. NPDC094034 TaxID=3155309 RepID=UPI00332F5789
MDRGAGKILYIVHILRPAPIARGPQFVEDGRQVRAGTDQPLDHAVVSTQSPQGQGLHELGELAGVIDDVVAETGDEVHPAACDEEFLQQFGDGAQ